MKISETINNGSHCWRVSSVISGKQVRRFFKTEAEAKAYASETKSELTTNGTRLLGLDRDSRSALDRALSLCDDNPEALLDLVTWALATKPKVEASPLVKDAFQAYITSKGEDGEAIRESSRKAIISALATFLKTHGEQVVSSVTVADVERWLSAKHPNHKEGLCVVWSKRTRKGYRGALNTFFRFCVWRKWCLENPVAGVKPPKLDQCDPGILSIEEATKLLETCRKTDKSFVGFLAIAMFCGIRAAELKKLKLADVKLDQKLICVGAPESKTRSRRFVVIPDNCIEWCKLGLELPPPMHRERFDRVRRLAGLLKSWPHNALRHSCASYSVAAHQNHAATAAGLGNSENMLLTHYRKPLTPAEGKAFFSIVPKKD